MKRYLDEAKFKQAVSTIEYMLARNSYNDAQKEALEIALQLLKDKVK